jgi:hypothetical protein
MTGVTRVSTTSHGGRRPTAHSDALPPMPRELATIMRPELPSLFTEMAAEIMVSIPEYAAVLNGPLAQAVQSGIEQNITTFVDLIATPGISTAVRDDLCREFGRLEAYEGRTLDSLTSAYRLGCQIALRRARLVGKRLNLHSTVMMAFADTLFDYMGEMIELSREGYRQALIELGEQPDGRRKRLLRLLLGGNNVSRTALTELAEHAAWPLPAEVTLVALKSGAKPVRGSLDRDILVDLSEPEPHMLVPGPMDAERTARLEKALHGCTAAIGLTTPLGEAADSLRWARHALALADASIIEGESRIIRCENHLLPLWLLGDPALVEQVAKIHLAPLVGLTPTQRKRLIDTLRIWLTTRGTAGQMAEILGVHPQTVRYRMRILDRAFGDQLSDPDDRFATEIALRALHLQDRTFA